eukprot:scaffold9301_cov30-Tisochrysis_lutea.AAC.4
MHGMLCTTGALRRSRARSNRAPRQSVKASRAQAPILRAAKSQGDATPLLQMEFRAPRNGQR